MANSKGPTGNLIISYYDSKGNHVSANYYGQTDAQAAVLIAAAYAIAGAFVKYVEYKSY